LGLIHSIDLLDDDDEILLALAEALGNLTDHIGGNQYASVLLTPLEKLCNIEETSVRDTVNDSKFIKNKAAQSIKKVLKLMDFKKQEDTISQLIKKFCSTDFHTSKSAAAIIIPSIYPSTI
jgi:serine/threonine-protein phosphatase 2A regulatory subunit A